MTGSELRRAPAGDGFAHELFGRDKESETDEHDDCVLTTDAVHVVVVLLKLYLANA